MYNKTRLNRTNSMGRHASIEVNLSRDPIFYYVGPLPTYGCVDSKGKPHIFFDQIVALTYQDRFENIDLEYDTWFNPSTLRGTKKDIQSISQNTEDTVVHELIHSLEGLRDEEVVIGLAKVLIGCAHSARKNA
jgi:hypothetical protein